MWRAGHRSLHVGRAIKRGWASQYSGLLGASTQSLGKPVLRVVGRTRTQSCTQSRWANPYLESLGVRSCAVCRIARCLPQNSGSASLYSDALPDLPPRPASRLQIWQVSKGNGEDQDLSCARIQQQTALGPRGAPSSAVHGHFPRAIKIGQNRGSDQPDSGAVSRRL